MCFNSVIGSTRSSRLLWLSEVFDGQRKLAATGREKARLPSSINSNTRYGCPGNGITQCYSRKQWRISTSTKQVLSQVNFYVQQHGARYGYILTNTEFVGGIGRPSVLLGLWYLGMLAAENDNGMRYD
ncbi:hypothetical protein GB937_009859 [Aspergillus fischeri]|nr:hypothetical protein GB937_009859 [Aspergillus fischeri]